MVGDIIKTLRKESGLTQIEFAKIFKISSGTIAMWETNKRQPDYETLNKIADFFNVSVDYLLGRDHANKNKDFAYASDNTVISIGRGGERVVYEISDEDAAIVNAFIEKMAKKN